MIDIDIDDTNAALDRLTSSMFHVEAPELRNRARDIAGIARMALDELEAARKSPMVALFDTTEARAELARIDAAWNAFDATRAYVAARALLDKVLAAIDAGWPVDVDGAALAAAVADGHEVEHLGALPPRAAEGYRTMTRAVLSHVGRAETRKPVAISDAVVEEAAIRAWLAVHDGRKARDDWQFYDEIEKDTYRAQARAVLEYAASIGGVESATSRRYVPTVENTRHPILAECEREGFTEAQTIERLALRLERIEHEAKRAAYNHVPGEVTPPPDDGREERLARYRESLLRGYAGNESDMGRLWAEHADHNAWPDFSAWLAGKAESIAHAMLAAERSPDRG